MAAAITTAASAAIIVPANAQTSSQWYASTGSLCPAGFALQHSQSFTMGNDNSQPTLHTGILRVYTKTNDDGTTLYCGVIGGRNALQIKSMKLELDSQANDTSASTDKVVKATSGGVRTEIVMKKSRYCLDATAWVTHLSGVSKTEETAMFTDEVCGPSAKPGPEKSASEESDSEKKS